MSYQSTDIKSIYTKKDKHNQINYYLRLKHNGKNYGFKNLTKLFKVKNIESAIKKKIEIMESLENGINPFDKIKKNQKITIDDYFNEFIKEREKNASPKHIDGYKWFYNKHIKPLYGHFNPKNIKSSDIHIMLDGTLNNIQWRSIKMFQYIMKSIFNRAIYDGVIKRELNPMDEPSVKQKLDIRVKQNKVKITDRLKGDLKDAAKAIYNEIMNVKIDKKKKLWLLHFQTKTALLLTFMVSRRRGEVNKLRWYHIDEEDKIIYADETITKTDIKESYPIPNEVMELIKELKKIKGEVSENDLIFDLMGDHNQTYMFNKIVKDLIKKGKIKYKFKDTKITLHNIRDIFVTIMAKETNNPYLADRCLSHIRKDVMGTYLDISDEERYKVFYRYWEILRGK